jgi:DnaJ-class molecular chaperone
VAIRCRNCNGSGVEDCLNCKGTGTVKVKQIINLELEPQLETCPRCDGDGTVPCRKNCDHGWIR